MPRELRRFILVNLCVLTVVVLVVTAVGVVRPTWMLPWASTGAAKPEHIVQPDSRSHPDSLPAIK